MPVRGNRRPPATVGAYNETHNWHVAVALSDLRIRSTDPSLLHQEDKLFCRHCCRIQETYESSSLQIITHFITFMSPESLYA